jgi:hypothetical protein
METKKLEEAVLQRKLLSLQYCKIMSPETDDSTYSPLDWPFFVVISVFNLYDAVNMNIVGLVILHIVFPQKVVVFS